MQDLSIRGEIKSLLNNEPFRDSKTPAGRLACRGVYPRRKFVKDKLAVSFLAFVHLASIWILLK